MSRRFLGPVVTLTCLMGAGCVASKSPPSATIGDLRRLPADETSQVLLVRHGWHTGIAIKRTRSLIRDLPESGPFVDADFVEVGWGDQAFYTGEHFNPLVMAKAAFLPSPSAIHLTGIRGSILEFFPQSEFVELDIDDEGLRCLCEFIHESFERDRDGEIIYLGPAIYGSGGFFQARGSYILPKTCNVWTAEALTSAGCPMVMPLSSTAQSVVAQSRRFGRVVQSKASFTPVLYPFINFEYAQNKTQEASSHLVSHENNEFGNDVDVADEKRETSSRMRLRAAPRRHDIAQTPDTIRSSSTIPGIPRRPTGTDPPRSHSSPISRPF